MSSLANPWVSGAGQQPEVAPAAAAAPTLVISGPSRPRPGAVAAPASGSLPVIPASQLLRGAPPPRWWWVGVHGGAGASTLAGGLGSSAAVRMWPVPDQWVPRCRVVLVARTHASGLIAARAALAQWAAGGVAGTELLGLVLVPDAPSLPKALKELSQLVGGGAPRVWRLPWIEQLRTEFDPRALDCAPVRRLARDLQALGAVGPSG